MSAKHAAGEDAMTGGASVWVVIVVYNSYADTADCLRSLAAATWPDLKAVLIDNGSIDGSGGRLAQEFPEHTHIRSDENLGFAGGCNLGIRKALSAGADHVCLLNNDTVVEPGFLEPLVARAETGQRVAAVGGKIFYDGPGDVIWFAGGEINRRSGVTTHRGQGLPDSAAFDRPMLVDYITGCLLLAPAGRFRELGLLDERLFMYGEELDFCLRARRAGYSCFYEPSSVIRHRVSRSMGGAYSPLYYYYWTRNLLLVYSMHLGAGRRRRWLASRQGGQLLWYFIIHESYIMLRAHRLKAGRFVAAIGLGFADFLVGRFGRCRYSWLAGGKNGSAAMTTEERDI
ncbi:MAG: glycosyltransferase family 2 protein [Thermoleophilia bacterium]